MTWDSWDSFEEDVKDEVQDTTSGYVGQIVVSYGYKVFASGHSDATSFFEAGENKADALNKAKEFAEQVGAGKPTNGFLVKVIKDSVLNRDVSSWKNDFTKFYAMFTDAIKKQIKPKMIEIGALPNEDFWGQVQFVPDEYFVTRGDAGKTDTDQDGNPRFPSVLLPVVKFANREAAVAAVGENETYTTQQNDNSHHWSTETLKNWSNEQINTNLKDILDAMQKEYDSTPGPDTLKLNKAVHAVVELYGISDPDLRYIWNEKPF